MKPVNIGGHPACQNRVLTQLRKYYPDAAASLPGSTWRILEIFWSLDLSAVDSLMQDRCSVFRPELRLPSDMLRALLVSVEFKIISCTRSAAGLKENHLHAIISDFSAGDTPGTGTFMISTDGFGSLIIKIFLRPYVRRKKSRRSLRVRKKKLPP